jgi:hypothetical protein
MSKLGPLLLLMLLSWVGTDGEEEAIKRLKDGGARVTEIKGYFSVIIPAERPLPDLSDLRALKRLGSLTLSGRRVTDAEMQAVGGLTKLRGLGLDGSAVTDAHLKDVKKLRDLRGLSLTGTRVTNAGLKELTELTDLLHLYLDDTAVTDEGISRLQKALPNCIIHR